jgi:hypothetical protein
LQKVKTTKRHALEGGWIKLGTPGRKIHLHKKDEHGQGRAKKRKRAEK